MSHLRNVSFFCGNYERAVAFPPSGPESLHWRTKDARKDKFHGGGDDDLTRKKRKGRRKSAEAALRAPPDESRPRCANNVEKEESR